MPGEPDTNDGSAKGEDTTRLSYGHPAKSVGQVSPHFPKVRGQVKIQKWGEWRKPVFLIPPGNLSLSHPLKTKEGQGEEKQRIAKEGGAG